MSVEDSATVVELADRLWRAEVDRTPIEPITETRADLTLADAYAIQAYNVGRRVEAGRAIRGGIAMGCPGPGFLRRGVSVISRDELGRG